MGRGPGTFGDIAQHGSTSPDPHLGLRGDLQLHQHRDLRSRQRAVDTSVLCPQHCWQCHAVWKTTMISIPVQRCKAHLQVLERLFRCHHHRSCLQVSAAGVPQAALTYYASSSAQDRQPCISGVPWMVGPMPQGDRHHWKAAGNFAPGGPGGPGMPPKLCAHDGTSWYWAKRAGELAAECQQTEGHPP